MLPSISGGGIPVTLNGEIICGRNGGKLGTLGGIFKLLCGTLLLRRLFRYLVLFNLVGRPYLLGRANFNASLLLDILLILLDGRA